MTRPPIYLSTDAGWAEKLRRICLLLFALMPLLLLLWRGGADAAASLIGVAFLVVLIARRQWTVMTQPLLLALLVTWLVLNLIVSPLAAHVPASFSRSIVWLRFVLLFAAAAFWLMPTRRDIGVVILLWIAALLVAMGDGTIQLFTGYSLSGQPLFNDRLTGPLDRPNIGMYVARVGLPLLLACVFLLQQARGLSRPTRLWAMAAVGAAILLTFTFILMTGERAASILTLASFASIAGVIALTIPAYRLYGLLFIGGTTAFLALVIATSERVMARLIEFNQVIEHFWLSHYGELFISGFTVWSRNLFTGVGMKNFQAACEVTTQSWMQHPCPQHPHNVYIEWLAETGIVGAAGYYTFVLLLIGGLIAMLWHHPRLRIVGAFVAGSFTVLLFPFTASQSIFSNWPALLFWSGLSLTMAVANLARRDEA